MLAQLPEPVVLSFRRQWGLLLPVPALYLVVVAFFFDFPPGRRSRLPVVRPLMVLVWSPGVQGICGLC